MSPNFDMYIHIYIYMYYSLYQGERGPKYSLIYIQSPQYSLTWRDRNWRSASKFRKQSKQAKQGHNESEYYEAPLIEFPGTSPLKVLPPLLLLGILSFAVQESCQGFLGALQVFFWSVSVRSCLHAKPLSGLTCSAAEKVVLQQCLYQDSYARTGRGRTNNLVISYNAWIIAT